MRSDMRRDFDLQTKYTPAMVDIVGRVLAPLLFCVAPAEADMRENSDLIVLRARDIRVACRVRAPAYLRSHPFDITIRSGRASGAATELHKMLAGFGHAFFYGFRAPSPPAFEAWRILSLTRLRQFFAPLDHAAGAGEFIRAARQRGLRHCGLRRNFDGVTDFVHLDVRELAEAIPGLLLASRPALPLLPCGDCDLRPGEACAICGARDMAAAHAV